MDQVTGKFLQTSDIPIPKIISGELIGAARVPIDNNKFGPSSVLPLNNNPFSNLFTKSSVGDLIVRPSSLLTPSPMTAVAELINIHKDEQIVDQLVDL